MDLTQPNNETYSLNTIFTCTIPTKSLNSVIESTTENTTQLNTTPNTTKMDFKGKMKELQNESMYQMNYLKPEFAIDQFESTQINQVKKANKKVENKSNYLDLTTFTPEDSTALEKFDFSETDLDCNEMIRLAKILCRYKHLYSQHKYDIGLTSQIFHIKLKPDAEN